MLVAISSRLGSIGANGAGGRSFAIDHPELVAALLHPGWVRTDMGGPGADLSPAESAAGMRRVIAGLTPADSGRFFDHDGSPIPW